MKNIVLLTNEQILDNIAVECPPGWRPIGQNCVIRAFVPPYTECLQQKSRWRRNFAITSPFKSIEPGLCVSNEPTGPIMSCPKGLVLYVSSINNIYVKESKKYICSGDYRRLIENESGMTCPMGYIEEQNKEGQVNNANFKVCKAKLFLPPDLKCPDNTDFEAKLFRAGSFKNEVIINCILKNRFKGRLWCPTTFSLINEPFSEFSYGEDIIVEIYNERIMDILNNPAKCIRWLAIPYLYCTNKSCKKRAYKNIAKIIRHWAYYWLNRDEEYILFQAIPNAYDKKWTSNHMRLPF